MTGAAGQFGLQASVFNSYISVYGASLETLIGHSSMVNTSAGVEGVM